MPLKTDYKNFIPSTTTKIHDIKQASDGTVINADVILEDVTNYSQEGDAFGSADINATNAQVNANTDAIALKAPLASPTFTGLITTAGQIAFPTTQNPSSNPNTLDDYEEGTFTPTIIGVSSTGIGTYTGQVGQYTKIGKIVFFSIYVAWTAHTGTGAMYVGNLPFNTSSVTASYSSLNVWQSGIAVGSGLVLTAYTNINQSSISLNKYNASTGSTSEQQVVNAGSLMLSGHFFTS